MRIDEVIHHTILAIYRDACLSSTLRLKGGSAMRIFDRLESRLSIDADFSVKGTIPNEKTFFSMMKKSLGKTFRGHGLDVIDFKWQRRPKKKSIDTDTIGLHVRNVFKEGELDESATTEESSVVQKEGKRKVAPDRT